jgi:hypothetical protein
MRARSDAYVAEFKAEAMGGRRAMASVWRAVVAGLTVAGWAEKSAYYNLPVTVEGSPAAPAPAPLMAPQ